MISRRQFLGNVAAGIGTACFASRLAWAAGSGIRLGACDWSMGAGSPEGLEIAKAIGLQGIEVGVGNPDKLSISDPALRQQYKDAMAKTGLVVPSLALGLMNEYPLATDPRGPAWLEQTIAAAKDMGAGVILVACFGNGDLLEEDGALKTKAVDAVVQRLADAAPKAKEAGVILGLENYLSAKQNLDILDRVKSDWVRCYYDVGNSTVKDYDVPAEIRTMGDRICQIHFKDGSAYLGKGDVAMDKVAESIAAINYKGWVILETAMPSKNRDADFKRNADYVKNLLKL